MSYSNLLANIDGCNQSFDKLKEENCLGIVKALLKKFSDYSSENTIKMLIVLAEQNKENDKLLCVGCYATISVLLNQRSLELNEDTMDNKQDEIVQKQEEQKQKEQKKNEIDNSNNDDIYPVYTQKELETLYPEIAVKVLDNPRFTKKIKGYKAIKKNEKLKRFDCKVFKTQFLAQSWIGHKENGYVVVEYHRQYQLIGEMKNGELKTHKSVYKTKLEKMAKTYNFDWYEITRIV